MSEDRLEEVRQLLDRLDGADPEQRRAAAELLRGWAEAQSTAPLSQNGLPGRFGMIAASPVMEEVFKVLARIVRTDAPVLVLGESGTGKELVARALHQEGPRRKGPFVPVNCAAIPGTLLESELFGHVKGAFTGAHRNRRGYAEAADGGTLFLDEIGDMPPDLQAKLLRFLQNGEVRPVGGNVAREVDVRVVAATNQDLARRVREKQFRDDLYYRLAVITIQLPPLRDRREDIPHLARFILAESGREKLPSAEIDPEAVELLQRFDWPGNIRQLQNELTRAAVFAREGRIRPEDLSEEVRSGSRSSGPGS